MKLKYQRLSQEEKQKAKEEFLKNKESIIYIKAHKIYVLSIIGIIVSIASFVFDYFSKSGTFSFILDGFLFIFSIIFFIVMIKVKLREINKFIINKKSKK
ncbi:MAG: hypothetical protein GX265_02340 [Mollicutes bacterium]|nr:hypothetical protein [Mollicutes bacterium]